MARNALVFVPVALTWYAIARAISAYRSLVSEGTGLANKSFLYLWETGMGGRLGFFERLSNIAVIDVAVILTVIALTIVGDRSRRIEETRQRALLDDIDDEWDGLLVEISLRRDADPQALLRALVEQGVEVQRFELVQPSLHQIFLEKVGATGVEPGMSGHG